MSLKFRQIDKTLNLLGVARVIGHGRWLGGVHLPASVVSPGHRKQVNTSVYRCFFLNVDCRACWATDVYCNCTSCQSCSRHSRWLPTLLQCPTMPEFKWKMRCKRKKKAAIQLCTFPARNLTVLACFSPRAGRRALNTNENCFHIFKNREQSPLKSLSRCLPEPSQGVQPCLPAIIWLV